MTTTALVPAAAPEPRSPGYGRAFGRVTVFGAAYGRTVPLAGALVRPYVPGTATPWPDPLYLDEADATAAVFPVATDASGAVALWADAEGRVELVCEATGYEPQRLVLDLESPPDAAPDPVDAYTKVESDALFLTQSEGDALYLPLDYVPPASGISQADADTRYVNTAADTMTGNLTIAQVSGNSVLTLNGSPNTGRGFTIQSNALDRWVIQTYGAETGSNAGSPFDIQRFDDAGGYLGTALSLNRATGAATFGGAVTVTGTGAFGADVTVTGNVQTSGGQAGFVIGDRATAPGWLWYSQAGTVRLLDFAFGDRLTINAAGDVNANASLSVGTTPYASAGAVRLPNGPTGTLAWRNAGNTADLTLGVASTDALVFTGGTLNVAPSNAAWPTLNLSGVAGTNRQIVMQTSGTDRWLFQGASSEAETGSSAGSNFYLYRCNDAGTIQYPAALSITRATGAAAVGGELTATTYSTGTTPATTGALRLPNAQPIGWRNAANSANFTLGVDASNWLATNTALVPTTDNTIGLGTASRRWALGYVMALSMGTTPASAGAVRMANTGNIAWRNAGNTADLTLGVDASDTLLFNGAPLSGGGGITQAAADLRYVQLTGGNVLTGSLGPSTSGTRNLGGTSNQWQDYYGAGKVQLSSAGYFQAGSNPASAGTLRVPNAATLSWRNTSNNGNLSLTMNASDQLALAVGASSLTTSATAGGATALPGAPSTYITVVVNGTTYKLAAWAV